jgi:hypothetical protein
VHIQLPLDSVELKNNIIYEPINLDKLKFGENDFLLRVKRQCFQSMIASDGESFTFNPS